MKNKAKAKTQTILIVVAVLLVIGFLFGKAGIPFVITGNEVMTRTAPTTVNPSSTFQVTYTVSGATGTWGASIVDAVSGGCKFPDGSTELKTVMLSTDGNTKQVTVTAPSSGSCTFVGDYKFGADPIVEFTDATVTIGSVCTPDCTCASSTCIGETCSNGCGGTCAGTKSCNGGTTCNKFFSDTMNWYDFTDNPCTNGYIITGIAGLVGLLVVFRLLK